MKFRLKRMVCRVVGHKDDVVAGAKLCQRCKRADFTNASQLVDWSAGS